MQQERMISSEAKQDKILDSEKSMDSDMQAHKVSTHEMVKSMTQTYREMERGLLKTIATHEEKVEA
jgi:hypothetical protein